MMASDQPRELVWLSPVHLEEIAHRFQTLRSWADGWGLPEPALERVRVWDTTDNPSNHLGTDWPALIAQQLFGASWRASQLAPRVAQECLTQFEHAFQAITGEAQVLSRQTVVSATEVTTTHGCALGVHLQFQWLDQSIVCKVTTASLRQAGLPPRPAVPGIPLWTAETALAHVVVSLQANFRPIGADVLDVLRLREGDVLVLQHTLDEPLQVQSPGSSLKLQAHLGRWEQQRGLQWLAPETSVANPR